MFNWFRRHETLLPVIQNKEWKKWYKCKCVTCKHLKLGPMCIKLCSKCMYCHVTHIKCRPECLNGCPASTMKPKSVQEKKVVSGKVPRNQGVFLAQGGSWARWGGGGYIAKFQSHASGCTVSLVASPVVLEKSATANSSEIWSCIEFQPQLGPGGALILREGDLYHFQISNRNFGKMIKS